MLRTAVVGTGSMGRNHVRILSALAGSDLVGIFDGDANTAAALAAEHGTEACASLEELLGRQPEAVVLAVPTTLHREIGERLFDAGCHVLVEKPIAGNLGDADALIAAAGNAGRILHVGHVEFFNPAVQALLSLEESARFVEVERLSTFSPRSLDVDVILDLMIHDLQLLHALDGTPIREIRATGIHVLSPKIDIANARLEFESGLVANVTASRVSATPARNLRVFGHQRYVSIDYREQEIKGYQLSDAGGGRQIVPIPVTVERREPLLGELEAFLAACRGEDARAVDGAAGREALATALALVEEIASH